MHGEGTNQVQVSGKAHPTVISLATDLVPCMIFLIWGGFTSMHMTRLVVVSMVEASEAEGWFCVLVTLARLWPG